MPWSRPFDDPIPTGSKPILTLKDAANYIKKLPREVYEQPHWQLAMEQLIEAAEDRGPAMHARIGMLRALNFGKPAPERERRARAYRIVK